MKKFIISFILILFLPSLVFSQTLRDYTKVKKSGDRMTGNLYLQADLRDVVVGVFNTITSSETGKIAGIIFNSQGNVIDMTNLNLGRKTTNYFYGGTADDYHRADGEAQAHDSYKAPNLYGDILHIDAIVPRGTVPSITISTNVNAEGYMIAADSFSLTGSGVKAIICYDTEEHAVTISSKTIIDGGFVVNGDFDANGNCIEDVCTLSVSSHSNFVGEHHDFAEISITTGATATTLTDQNVWYQVTTLTSTIGVRGLTVGGNEIIISTKGWYHISLPITFSGTVKDKTIEFGVFKNNGAYGTGDGNLEHLRATQLTNGVGTFQTITIIGKAYFDVGDHIEVWARCTCSGSNSITVRHGVLDVDKR